MTTPYYRDASVTLYHGDAREVLPLLPRGSVDLIVTDPPYGVRRTPAVGVSRTDGRFAEPMAGDDGSLDVAAVLNLGLAALKMNRHLYVFGPADLSACPVTAKATLIWAKGGPGVHGDLSLPWGTNHEPITFAMYAPSKAQRDRGSGGLSARLRQGSVLSVPKLSARQVSRHPTEKPVKLLRMLIEASSLFDETVLDPFAGSGSTLEAAVLEGRQAVGVEIDERYCEVAAERLRGLR